MRRVVLTVLGLTLLPSLALAQAGVENCFSCILGIFDDIGVQNPSGTINPFELKEIYLGIVLPPGQDGVTSLELSIAGLPGSAEALVTLEGVEPFSADLGSTINAPPDTSIAGDESSPYGKVYGWSTCLSGTRALVKISIFPFAAVAPNTVYEVKRRYPSTYPPVRSPLIIGCDAPTYTAYRVSAGCYVANPSGGPLPVCTTAVQPATWTGVKQLFR